MSRKTLFSLLLIPVAGALIAGYATAPHGTGVSPDTMAFLNVAHHLQAGEGVSAYYPLYSDRSHPLAAWPPLFPALIWTGMPFGIHPLDTAWVVNLILFAANILLAGLIAARATRSVGAGLVLQAAFALYTHWRGYFVWGLSEPLFLLLINLAMWFTVSYLNSGRIGSLMAAAMAVGLSEVTRYIGGVYIPIFAGIVFLLGPGRITARLGAAARFGVVAMIPPVVWAVRNYLRLDFVDISSAKSSWADRVFGSLMHKQDEVNGLVFNIISGWDACALWAQQFLGGQVPTAVAAVALAAAALAGGWFTMRAFWRSMTLPAMAPASTSEEAVLGAAAFLYAAGLAAGLTFSSFVGGTPDRYLLPTVTHGVMLLIIAGHRVLFGRSAPGPLIGLARLAVIAACFTWIFTASADSLRWIDRTRSMGADESRGARSRNARAYNWFPTEARAREFRERKLEEDRRLGRSF